MFKLISIYTDGREAELIGNLELHNEVSSLAVAIGNGHAMALEGHLCSLLDIIVLALDHQHVAVDERNFDRHSLVHLSLLQNALPFQIVADTLEGWVR